MQIAHTIGQPRGFVCVPRGAFCLKLVKFPVMSLARAHAVEIERNLGFGSGRSRGGRRRPFNGA